MARTVSSLERKVPRLLEVHAAAKEGDLYVRQVCYHYSHLPMDVYTPRV